MNDFPPAATPLPAPQPASAPAPTSASAPTSTFPPPLDRTTRRRMGLIIVTQCLGILSILCFTNGFMQMYLQKKLQLAAVDALFYVSLPFVMQALMLMPMAYFSDRYGKKKFGQLGNFLMAGGIGLLGGAGALAMTATGPLVNTLALVGILLVGGGYSMHTSSWFALLQPIIPMHVRGRFFGALRVSWQVVSVVAFTITTWFLDRTGNALNTFLIVLLVLTGMLVVRGFLYFRIPELETERAPAGELLKSLVDIMRRPGYMPYCSYLFLLNLFTGAAPFLFPLLEGEVLNFAPDRIVLFGTIMFVGQVFGFLLGGLSVDRVGTRMVFVFCHMGFGGVLAGTVLRGAVGVDLWLWIGLMRFLYGVAYGGSSIAITSELLSLLPEKNKSLATALALSLIAAGVSLAGVLASKVVALHALADHWMLGDLQLSQYDFLLLACAVMVTLLTVTLSLVPSVIRKAGSIAQ